MVIGLKSQVAERPNEVALTDETGTTTWVHLNDQANRWILGLRGLGIQPGDRIAVMTGNRREAWEVFVAALHAGFVLVIVPWDADVERTRYIMEHSDARLLIMEDACRPVAVEATADLPLVARLTLDGATGDGVHAAADLLYHSPPIEPDGQMAGGPMFYTSGTTGAPKGVIGAGINAAGGPISDVLDTAAGVAQGLGIDTKGVALIAGPLYHSGQFVLSTFPMLAGQRIVIRRTTDPAGVLEAIDRYHVGNTLLLPSVLGEMLRLPEDVRARFKGTTLQLLMHTGAPCPPHVKRGMIDWLGPKVVEIYGASEGGMFAMGSSQDFLDKPGSVGRILPFIEATVIGPDDTPVAPGEEGEIFLRYRNGNTFSYHKAPEKTAEAYREPGQFTLGDIGRIDEDGYLFISGRRSHVITVNGVWVHPNHVEQGIAAFEQVNDVGVFDGGPEGGPEEVHVSVVPAEGVDPATLADAVRGWAAETMTPEQVPTRVHVVESIPRNASGKILRDALREAALPG
ncbi:MAG: AMP-binding protein [Actinomycetota bacterium]